MLLSQAIKDIMLRNKGETITSKEIKTAVHGMGHKSSGASIDTFLYNSAKSEDGLLDRVGRGVYTLSKYFKDQDPTPKTPSNELTEAQTGRAIISYVEQLQSQFRELSTKYSEDTDALRKTVITLRADNTQLGKYLVERDSTLENQRTHIRKLTKQLANAQNVANGSKTFKLGELARVV